MCLEKKIHMVRRLTKMKRILIGILAVTIISILLAGCASSGNTGGSANTGWPKVVSIAVKPPGTAAYTLTVGFANIMTKYLGTTKVVVEPLGGETAYLSLMEDGKVEMAESTLAMFGQWYKGQEPYASRAGKKSNIRLLAAGHFMEHVFVVRPDKGINSIKDFKGKRISYIEPGSPVTTMIGENTMAFYGLSKNDVIGVTHESPPAGGLQVTEDRADATLGGMSVFTEPRRAINAFIIPIPEEATKYIQEKVPGLGVAQVSRPAGYMDSPNAVSTVGFAIGIIGINSLPDDLVYKILKTLYDEHLEEFQAVAPICKEWTIQSGVKISSMTIPFHNGAIKYFKEKGVWTAEHDKKQQELLTYQK
jgi:TRAP transporter TAXI family solute receptor